MITEEQKKQRALGIGGSDIAVILGLSKYKTAYQLYLEKTGQIDESSKTSQAAYWGNKLEDVVRKEFSERNNVEVEVPDTIVHPLYMFLRGNLDGFIPEWNAVLEIKCSSSFMANEWGESGSDFIPMQYLVQVAHYCAITNADCAYIVVLIGGNDYREFKYIRNLELELKIIDAAKEFWNCVQTRTPPYASNEIDLKIMYPKHTEEKKKAINDEIKSCLQVLGETRLQIKKLNTLEESNKFNIMQFMQDAECLVNEEGVPIISWKSNKKGTRTFLVKEAVYE